jgi:predicted amino acid dehydrogenase
MSDTRRIKVPESAGGRAKVVEGNIEVLRRADVIVSAVTGTIDLDVEDPDCSLDLKGKVIIDDSQPACFDREQVERRGGKLVWVVGTDGSHDEKFTRVNGYNFGNEAGFASPKNMWGCEAEAAVLALSGRHDLAIDSHVTAASAQAIGDLFTQYGIKPAEFQSFGSLVDMADMLRSA